MEHNAIQWLGAPSCQRGSYAFYKSVSSRSRPEEPVQVWRLGEFYFIRCGPQDPVCIAEVTLLWEDQSRRHLLASARLYFLPEDTPKGRTREHGEDEVLAVSRKMVVRVEDLVRWSCSEPAAWSTDALKWTSSCGINGLHKSAPDRGGEPLRDRTPNGMPELRGVKVLSYPQYCRFRSLQRRIQDAAQDPGLQDPHLLALGGVKVHNSTRLMYCRDTFNHPTLEGSASFSWQFRCPSLSLRGRPRKRRGRDSPNSIHPESWIERMKENVMGSVEVGLEGSWLPHPEEQLFLDQLLVFMERRGSPIHKIPNLGFKKIDLFLLYSVVKRLGGYKKVTSDRLWKVVYNELGGCPGSTSAATCTRRHYERLMLPYEEHLRAAGAAGGAAAAAGGAAAEFKVPESPVPHRPRGVRGRKSLIRGRKPGPRTRVKRGGASGANALRFPDGSVVKRGRGRPPGTRNKSSVLSQKQLLSKQEGHSRNRVELPAKVGGVSAGQIISMPRPPDSSHFPTPFPVFPKAKDLKAEWAHSTSPAPSVLLSTLPRHFVGGSLGGFSPIKGVCPLDVFRSCMSLQRSPESPGLTPQDPAQCPPTLYTLQSKGGGSDVPQPPPPQHPNRCSGCDDGGQRGAGCRDSRGRAPLPPLRVLPLNLDCSVQVCQLMRTRRLDSSQLQTFTRRLSEALSQDLSPPATPPPEQALPLNLSRRFAAKRPVPQGAELHGDQSPSKRSRSSEDCGPVGHEGGGGGGPTGEGKNQEEPADLSSPSRIRAFLLGLPPFQVKMEEDVNGMRIGKLVPPGSETETCWTDGERGGTAEEEQQKEVLGRWGEEEEEPPGREVEAPGCEEEEAGQEEKQETEKMNKVHQCQLEEQPGPEPEPGPEPGPDACCV